jgi:hypothetical protein
MTSTMGAATVKTTAAAVGIAAPMETAAEARVAAGRICARDAAMIETAEGVGMNTGGCAARKSARVTETGMVGTRRSAIEMIVIAKGPVAIDESRTVGDIGVVVV